MDNTKLEKVLMVVQDRMVKGGIAAVVSGYYGSKLEKDYEITYVESYKDGGKFTKLFKALSGYLKFIKVIILNKPDLIHIHSSFGPSFYRKIPFIYMAHWAKIPIVNHIHGSEFDKLYLKASESKQNLVRKVWGKCNAFIVLSEEWKETFSVVIPREKMTVIENYSKLVSEIKRKNNGVLLFMGLINEMKGCYDIVDVVEKVSRQIPNVKMIMCGEGDIEQIKDKASSKGILDKFVFPGWVRDQKKDEILREANIFFLPSYSEGMPMSILDAMGYGLPIVASKVGGIPKIVRNNGEMCEPGDIDGFSQKIVELLQDDKKLFDAGRESRNIVQSEYSLDAHIEKIENLYDSVISED